MKIDYNKLMHEQISSFGDKPKLLLHCCCAPCSSAVIEKIEKHFNITYYYYNPNIYPQEEFEQRKVEFKKLGVDVVSEHYNHQDFLNIIKNHEKDQEGGLRCQICIAHRMDKSFEYAAKHGFDYVTTTLSISPHKNATFINETGVGLAKKHNVKFLFADFKKQNGYLRSIQICKEKEIYRQDYCGCEFAKNKND